MQSVTKILGSRTFQFAALPVVILVWFALTDPSHGADTLLRVQLLAQALLVTGFAYLISKAFTGSASSERLYMESLAGNQSAGLAYLGMCLLRGLVLLSLLVFFGMVQR